VAVPAPRVLWPIMAAALGRLAAADGRPGEHTRSSRNTVRQRHVTCSVGRLRESRISRALTWLTRCIPVTVSALVIMAAVLQPQLRVGPIGHQASTVCAPDADASARSTALHAVVPRTTLSGWGQGPELGHVWPWLFLRAAGLGLRGP